MSAQQTPEAVQSVWVVLLVEVRPEQETAQQEPAVRSVLVHLVGVRASARALAARQMASQLVLVEQAQEAWVEQVREESVGQAKVPLVREAQEVRAQVAEVQGWVLALAGSAKGVQRLEREVVQLEGEVLREARSELAGPVRIVWTPELELEEGLGREQEPARE